MRHFIIKDIAPICRSPKYVGNKAANLSLLLHKDYSVPAFFVLSTELFKHIFKLFSKSTNNINNHDDAKDFFNSLKYGSKQIPLKFWKSFEKHFDSLQLPDSELKVSVRSSSPFEDQATQSFAGQFESYLDIEGLDEVWDAVEKCWLSMWHPNVLSYLEQSNLKHSYKAMAVIVQKMIHADVAGVLFTREPVSNDNSKMLIEFSSGAPDDVVSGKVEPWRIQIDKKTKKEHWLSAVESKEEERKEFEKVKELLQKEKTQELTVIGKNLEIQFGFSVDIEWAIEKRRLWLLQVRPLTTGLDNERQRRDNKGDLWTDYFFVERFVDPVTPLGWSIIGKWIEKRALREPLYFMGFDELLRRKKLTRLFDSFPYTRVEVFQFMYSVIPDFAISEDKKQAFLKMDSRRLWLKELIQRLPFIFSRLLLRDINWFPPFHLREWQRFLARYLNQLKKDQPALDSLDLAVFGRWFLRVELLTDQFLYYHRWSITFADLFYHLLEYLLPILLPELKSLNCVELISGLPGNKTVEANLELAQLAQSLIINITENKKLDIKQLNVIPGFQSQFELFIRRHGHRSQNLDPYSPPWRDNSEFIKRMIVDMISEPKTRTVIETSHNRLKNNRLKAEALLFTNFLKEKNVIRFIKKKLIKYILNMTQSFALLRENQRYYWHIALAEQRRIILEVGERLAKRKILAFPEQVFFLQRSEFLQCFESDVDPLTLQQKAEQRQKKWESCQAKPRAENIDKKTPKSESTRLHGFGVSAGKIQARAHVVHSLAEAQKMQPGTILVTGSVDPAWTPVFAKAAGLVLEVGGILSHAAIVAREFQLPAVTSVAGATSKIRDNQLVEIDGLKGTVTIIQEGI